MSENPFFQNKQNKLAFENEGFGSFKRSCRIVVIFCRDFRKKVISQFSSKMLRESLKTLEILKCQTAMVFPTHQINVPKMLIVSK